MFKAVSLILAVTGLAATIGSVGARTGGKSIVCPVMKGTVNVLEPRADWHDY